ncbi:lipopolysaccharide kinase InaA family protein [Tannerella forsythia]|uniref:lipopolysaccharide kinase InaA family protein n=1 Tax=Tannerella forsythia TaxID=28112 RepID=UPI0028E6C564|nr:lipopolysaccharide kinase InaA family protein [Tannerella forsythia]
MRFAIHPAYSGDEVETFLEQLPMMFDGEGEMLYDKRNQVKRFVLPSGCPVIVKRFKKPILIQRIIYGFFRKTKAQRAYLYAAVLRHRGFGTPHEIAYLEQRRRGLLSHCYFLAEEDGAPAIYERLVAQHPFDRVIADDFAALVAALHQKSILHGDLNPTNVLFRTRDDGHYTFSLIDTNRMRFKALGQNFTAYECLNNLTRFDVQDELYHYVLRRYIECMGWEMESYFAQGIEIKRIYDEHRKKRKAFLKKFK